MGVKKEAIELHKKHKGKIEVVSKIALNTLEDLSLVYTPGMTVMEGKAVLFKELGDVDAFPICLESQETEDIIFAIKQIAPSFGGINLEDIATPKCFEIEKRLKEELDIPVFHDDQHGTGRSDFPNQVNNVLVFPGIFKGGIIMEYIIKEVKDFFKIIKLKEFRKTEGVNFDIMP